MTFHNKTIAITGASSGIGAACAALLKHRGAKVIGLDINEPAPGSVDQFIAFNQGLLDSIDQAVAQIPAGIDGLLNIAGVAPSPRFSPAAVLKINFFGLRYFTEKMIDKLNAGAAIVNMTSGTGAGWPTNVDNIKAFLALDRIEQVDGFVAEHGIGSDGLENSAAYPFSKQLLSVWTLKSSSCWKEQGIRINAVAPAAVDTPIIGDFMSSFGEESAQRMKKFGAATPENIALATVFLISDDAVWVNGVVLPVDGGAIAGGTLMKLGL
ncbi:MAG: coniferyl-alcohol dehydrogenase [Halopseudomonas sp.]